MLTLERLQAAMSGGADPTAMPALTADLDRLFGAYQDRIYWTCLRFVGNQERALEIAQEALLLGWQKLPEFRPEARFGTWLHAIARNLCFNAVRKRSELITEDGLVDPDSPEAGVLRQLQREERKELLLSVSRSSLDPLEQEAVYLRYVEQLPQDRITELLEIEGKAGARGVLQRCRRKLKRAIVERLGELGHGLSFVQGTV